MGGVCLSSVCLSVCEQDYAQNSQSISSKLYELLGLLRGELIRL